MVQAIKILNIKFKTTYAVWHQNAVKREPPNSRSIPAKSTKDDTETQVEERLVVLSHHFETCVLTPPYMEHGLNVVIRPRK